MHCAVIATCTGIPGVVVGSIIDSYMCELDKLMFKRLGIHLPNGTVLRDGGACLKGRRTSQLPPLLRIIKELSVENVLVEDVSVCRSSGYPLFVNVTMPVLRLYLEPLLPEDDVMDFGAAHMLQLVDLDTDQVLLPHLEGRNRHVSPLGTWCTRIARTVMAVHDDKTPGVCLTHEYYKCAVQCRECNTFPGTNRSKSDYIERMFEHMHTRLAEHGMHNGFNVDGTQRIFC